MSAISASTKSDTSAEQAKTLPLLFQPIALRGVTARNRIVVSPMSQYCAVDAAPTDWHLVHLGKFAMGGAGIIFVEETAVEERARKTYHCPGIYTDAQAKALAAHHRFSARARRPERHPARPCRPQGGDQIAVGRIFPTDRSRRPNGRATMARHCAKPHRLQAGRDDPDRDGSRRHQDGDPQSRRSAASARSMPVSISARSTARTATFFQQFLSPITNKRTDGCGGDIQGGCAFTRADRGGARGLADRPAAVLPCLLCRWQGRRMGARGYDRAFPKN